MRTEERAGKERKKAKGVAFVADLTREHEFVVYFLLRSFSLPSPDLVARLCIAGMLDHLALLSSRGGEAFLARGCVTRLGAAAPRSVRLPHLHELRRR